MAVQIGTRPDSGFDDPLGMLKDCHRRIENFLRVLCHVADRTASGALTSEERDGVEAALQYFRIGGQRHNQDEEDSLFPRLRSAGADRFDAIERLENDHRTAAELHTSVAQLFSAWVATGTIGSEDRQALQNATRRLKDLYADHIKVEETAIFPEAARVLGCNVIAQIGAEFRERRNEWR